MFLFRKEEENETENECKRKLAGRIEQEPTNNSIDPDVDNEKMSSCDRRMLAQGYPIFTSDVYYTAFHVYYMLSFDSLSASSAFLPDTFCLASLSFAFNSSTVNSSYNC